MRDDPWQGRIRPRRRDVNARSRRRGRARSRYPGGDDRANDQDPVRRLPRPVLAGRVARARRDRRQAPDDLLLQRRPGDPGGGDRAPGGRVQLRQSTIDRDHRADDDLWIA